MKSLEAETEARQDLGQCTGTSKVTDYVWSQTVCNLPFLTA
jgi:hypothetical protein